MNIKRGIRKSLRYSMLGFSILATVIGLVAIYHFTFHEIHPIDRQNDFARLPILILVPSLGIAFVFGLAAFGSFAPDTGMPFIRSLIVISSATLLAVLVTRPSFILRASIQSICLAIALTIGVALLATVIVLVFREDAQLENRDEDKA